MLFDFVKNIFLIPNQTLDDKAENLSDNRVSKYIDHDHVEKDTVDFGNNKNFDNDVTLESILDSTQVRSRFCKRKGTLLIL